ncbi:hypothetical protein O77CONTIG1_04832 [Leptolyngbya sp. O-77]|nr:hypothetical protein O77CONTIG1_04832 [Leptolyngbya sp. O-77]
MHGKAELGQRDQDFGLAILDWRFWIANSEPCEVLIAKCSVILQVALFKRLHVRMDSWIVGASVGDQVGERVKESPIASLVPLAQSQLLWGRFPDGCTVSSSSSPSDVFTKTP